jgi:LmbE family N-acetylglucosaminyl deacetylase
MTVVRDIELGAGRTILLVVAHADDAARHLGGTILRWSVAGWRVVCARVTDDRWDGVGLTEADTIAANAREFKSAAQALGIAETVEFKYAADALCDVGESELRTRVMREIRRHKPYALVSMDPRAACGEDEPDQIKVAAAVDAAFWASQRTSRHPEPGTAGLAAHGCFERWYFGDRLTETTDVVDIGCVLERKIGAALRHRTRLRSYANQLRLQAQTGGWEIEMLDDIAVGGDARTLMDTLLRADAREVGERHGMAAAEAFRVVRFGGLGALLERFGRRRPRWPKGEDHAPPAAPRKKYAAVLAHEW